MIELPKKQCNKEAEPEPDVVLAVTLFPVLSNLEENIFNIPAPECAKYAIPVVPRFPAQFLILITDDPLEEENVIPVLLVQLR